MSDTLQKKAHTLKYEKNRSYEFRIAERNDLQSIVNSIMKEEKTEGNTVADSNTGGNINTGTPYFIEELKNAVKTVRDIENRQNAVKNSHYRKDEELNNRIIFVGQRGSGKTSAMMSFVELMTNHGEECGCNHYERLPMVDPSKFENNTNILLSVITTMFSQTKELLKKGENDETVIRAGEDLLGKFNDVYKAYGAVTNEKNDSYSLETLNNRSLATNLSQEMHELVDRYLYLIKKCKKNEKESSRKNSDKLILPIDDIDMTVSRAPEMLEQIRKYLSLDNLLIVLSGNLDQMYNEMLEYYSQSFKGTLRNGNDALSVDVEDLASKYLLKLFPTTRRIRVERDVSQLLNTTLEIEGKSTEFQKAILSLIWEKTRLLFVPEEGTLHPIIPTNLRELNQFLDMLTSLYKVEFDKGKLFKDGNAYTRCKNNFNIFKNYILHTWMPNRLSVKEEKVFENIPSDITEINKHLINSINAIGTDKKKNLLSREVNLDIIERNAEGVIIDRDIYTMVSPNDPRFVKANKISDIFNRPSNYSYGDLLLMIDKYETYFESGSDRRFTNAIKIYYSMLLFETMFFKSTDVSYNKPEEKEKPTEEDKVKLIPIQQLIGGTVYYPNYFEIISDKYFSQKGPSYDAKRAFYHKLEDNGDEVQDKYPLFSILYYGDIRPDRSETKHIYDTNYEDDSLVDGKHYVTFDILSILSNMLNPWHTIMRFNTKEKIKELYQQESKSTWEKDIDDWRNQCKYDNFYSPNAILPFYSVDIMLRYLKEEIPSTLIISEDLSLYDELEKKINKSLSELFNKEKDVSSLANVNEEKPNQSGTPNDYIKTLESIYEVYHKVLALEDDLREVGKIDFISLFREFAIANIMEHFQKGERERETLIKGLYKYKSIAEMYRYLVDELFRKPLREALIRSKIQESIRKKESVSNYYDELWKRSNKILNSIGINYLKENAVEVVYLAIFNKAAGCFIWNEHTDLTYEAPEKS